AEQVGGHADDVGVVMAAGDLGGDVVVDQCGADAVDLVSGDAHADARAADEHRAIGPALGDGARRRPREVGVVATAAVVAGGHVDQLVALASDQVRQRPEHRRATVVATQRNLHGLYSTDGRNPNVNGSGNLGRFHFIEPLPDQ